MSAMPPERNEKTTRAARQSQARSITVCDGGRYQRHGAFHWLSPALAPRVGLALVVRISVARPSHQA